jgi:ADP-ribose pyrophosphatase YjhB (NUDIX family)
MGIRNAAKALIISGGKMLINKNQNSTGLTFYDLPNGAIYYDLPGGGQNQYETLQEAVIRECREETGYTVTVERLAAVYEEIAISEAFRTAYEPYAHKVHFIFVCRLTDEPIRPLAEKDLDMLESVWVDMKDISKTPLYPKVIRDRLTHILASDGVLYLGVERV